MIWYYVNMFLERIHQFFILRGPTGNRTQIKGFRVPCTYRYTIEPPHSYIFDVCLNDERMRDALSLPLQRCIQTSPICSKWNGLIDYIYCRRIDVLNGSWKQPSLPSATINDFLFWIVLDSYSTIGSNDESFNWRLIILLPITLEHCNVPKIRPSCMIPLKRLRSSSF